LALLGSKIIGIWEFQNILMKILSVAEIGIFLWLLIGDIKKIKKIVYENKKNRI
jgi:hypothetical protein